MEKFKKFTHPAQLIYFSDKGESMSDAQNMKGKCTQVAEDVKSQFAAIGPVKETVLFDGKDVNLTTPKAIEAAELSELVGKDAEANALNGWYARAIDAKNNLLDSIRNQNWTMFLKEDEAFQEERFEEEWEEPKFELERPQLKEFTEEDVLAEWSANEVADFLMKEQYCATVGKLIHKKGKLHQIYNSPLTETSRFQELASGERGGTKAYPVTITPVYEGEDLKAVKNVYLTKHDEHRETEKKVNWYKAKIKNELTEKNAAAQREFADAMGEFTKKSAEFNEKRIADLRDYQARSKKFLDKVRGENEKLRATCEERRQLLVKEASALKIFIPENLRPTKKFVETYSIK